MRQYSHAIEPNTLKINKKTDFVSKFFIYRRQTFAPCFVCSAEINQDVSCRVVDSLVKRISHHRLHNAVSHFTAGCKRTDVELN